MSPGGCQDPPPVLQLGLRHHAEGGAGGAARRGGAADQGGGGRPGQGVARGVPPRPRLPVQLQRAAAQLKLVALRLLAPHPLLHGVAALPAAAEQTLRIRGSNQRQVRAHGPGPRPHPPPRHQHGGLGLPQVSSARIERVRICNHNI